MVKVQITKPSIGPVQIGLIGVLIYYLYQVVWVRVINQDQPIERAMFYFMQDTTVLKEGQQPEGIDEQKACIVDTKEIKGPIYTFEGTEVVNTRDLKCNTCHKYVFKEGEKCSPLKYREDGFCVLDESINQLCPF
jgi:hypothetical protein